MEGEKDKDTEKLTSYDIIVDTKLTKSKGLRSTYGIVALILGIALAAGIIIIVGLAAGLGVEKARGTSTSEDTTCTTPSCIELSNQILSSLDDSIDPCNDFYLFSCNGFIRKTIIPFGVGTARSFTTPRSINVERIRSLMESGNNRGLEAIAKAITYYQSCMRGMTLQEARTSLTEVITSLGGWPLVGINLNTQWDINSRSGFLTEQLYTSPAFFALGVATDPSNSSRNILAVDQSGLTIPARVIYQQNATRDYLKGMMLKAFQLLNPSISDDVYNSAIDEILNFEAQITNYYDFDARRRLPTERIRLMSYDQLSGLMPVYNWVQNIQYFGSLGGIAVDTNLPVNVLAPDFLRSVNALIQRTNTTILENYSKWQLLYKALPFLSREFSDIHYTILKILTGNEEPPRYQICVNNVEQLLPLAISRAFTEQFLPPGSRGNLSEILVELERALNQRISGRDWLDDATKQRALNKLNFVNEFLAYPDMVLNNTFLNGYYSTLNLSLQDGYFFNHINTVRFSRLQQISSTGEANNRSQWSLKLPPPSILNAFYNPQGNQIYIFEGILNTPFFKTYWPLYFKFGTIGFVVGHEYTHGFDNTGQQFNEVGNLENWWTDASLNEFRTRTQCFVDQYNSYSLPAGPVNGTFTLGENIADNGGLATAYQAYKNRVKSKGEVMQKLPGLLYNPDQLFFIGATQLWCQVATLQNQQQTLLGDNHSPDPIRPLGILSNSREFAAAFNCPTGSRMNPVKKCELW